MPRWQVRMEVDELIEADTAEQAIEKAGNMNGGWMWNAVDIDRTADQQFVTAVVLVNAPAAVRWVAGVQEWDNGWWYDHYNVSAILPDGSEKLLAFDVDHPLHKFVHDSLTALSERDGPLGRHSELTVEITDEQRAAVYCQACAAVLEPDGWDDAGTPVWSDRVSEDLSDAICPMGGTHVPVGGRERAGDEHY